MYRELKNLFELGKLRDDMHEIYFNQVIETFAISLISVFIPIYLLQNGFHLLAAFAFMLAYWAAFLLAPVAAEISSHIGFKHTIIYRAPLMVAYFILVFFVGYLSQEILFIALLGGFSAILYWVSTNAEFVKAEDEAKGAKQVGYLNALPQVSSVAAPLISALLLSTLGFAAVFAIVITLIVISQLPFLLTSDYKEGFRLKMRKSWFLLDKRFFALFLIQGMIFSNDFLVWSLFVYQKFGLISAGLTASLYGAGMVIFTLVIGRAVSSGTVRRSMLILGAIGYVFICIVRISTSTVTEVILISMLAGMFTTMISVPIYTSFAERAKKSGILNWVTFRDFSLGLGRVSFMLLAVSVLMFSAENVFYTAFTAAAISSILLILLAR